MDSPESSPNHSRPEDLPLSGNTSASSPQRPSAYHKPLTPSCLTTLQSSSEPLEYITSPELTPRGGTPQDAGGDDPLRTSSDTLGDICSDRFDSSTFDSFDARFLVNKGNPYDNSVLSFKNSRECSQMGPGDTSSESPIPCLRLRDSFLNPGETEIDDIRVYPNSDDNFLDYQNSLANPESCLLEGDDRRQFSGKALSFGRQFEDQNVGREEDGSPADDEGGDGEEFWTADLETASLGSSPCRQIIGEAEELLEEVRDVTIEAGRLVSSEVKEGLEQLATPEEAARFGASDVAAALLTVAAFNSDLLSDLFLARHLAQGDDLDRRWALATLAMAVGPLVIVNAFSIYWYWFDSRLQHDPCRSYANKKLLEPLGQCQKSGLLKVAATSSANGRNTAVKNRHSAANQRRAAVRTRKVGGARAVLTWLMRGVMHLVLQANTLRQLDLLYYGTLSLREEQGRSSQGCEAECGSSGAALEGGGCRNRNIKKVTVESSDFYEISIGEKDHTSGRETKIPPSSTIEDMAKFHSIMEMDRETTLLSIDSRKNPIVGDIDSMNGGTPHMRKQLCRDRPTDTASCHDRLSVLRSITEGASSCNEDGKLFPPLPALSSSRCRNRWLHAESDAAALDLIGAILQDVPQVILQLYLLAYTLPIFSDSLRQSYTLFGSLSFDSDMFFNVSYLRRMIPGNSLLGNDSTVLGYALLGADYDMKSLEKLYSGDANETDAEYEDSMYPETELLDMKQNLSFPVPFKITPPSKKNNILDDLLGLPVAQSSSLSTTTVISAFNIIWTDANVSLFRNNTTLDAAATTSPLPENNSSGAIAQFLVSVANSSGELRDHKLEVPEELLPETAHHLLLLQGVCVCASLCAVSWSASSWVRAVRLATPTMTNLSPASLVLLTVAHLAAIIPQVLCYSILAAVSPRLLVSTLLFLWLINSGFILAILYCWSKEHRDHLAWFPHDLRTGVFQRVDDVCLSGALGLVFLFTFVDLGGDAGGRQVAGHALFRLGLQTLVAAAWSASASGGWWLVYGPSVLVGGAWLTHALLTIGYFKLLQLAAIRAAGGEPTAFGTADEIRARSLVQEELETRNGCQVIPESVVQDEGQSDTADKVHADGYPEEVLNSLVRTDNNESLDTHRTYVL